MEALMLEAITECILSYTEKDHSLESLSNTLLHHAKELTGSKMAILCGVVYDNQGAVIDCPCYSSLVDDDVVNTCNIPVSHNVLQPFSAFGKCVKTTDIVIIDSFDREQLRQRHPEFPKEHPQVDHAAFVPLIFKSKPCGLLGLANRAGGYQRAKLDALHPFFIVTANILESFRVTEEQVQLAQSVADAKDAFLAKISHEIRTPLNGIVGMTRVLLNMGLSQDMRQKMDIINECSYQLISHVDDLLDYTKMTCGKLSLNIDAVCIRKCVERAFDVIAVKASEKGLTINQIIDPSVPSHALTDGKRLRQILVNLLTNAVKFTQEGSIVVNVSMAAKDVIKFDVVDTGVGIDPEDQRCIFDTFTQGKSGCAMAEGAGLGLAICSKLVDLMKGIMTVSSRMGQGSCFTFTITAPETAVPQSELSQYTASLQGMTALIVDDIVLNRVVLCTLLQKWGISSVMCESGANALEYLKSGLKFDVGFIDIQMPGMDGYELARQIRCGQYQYFPLIAVSSVDTWTTSDGLLFTMMLQKPLKQDVVYNALMKVLRPTAVVPSAPSPRRSSNNVSILIAEDCDTNQKVIQSQLDQLGYTNITIVNNGLQAVQEQQKRPYNIILMDLKMPVMNGFDATRRIRKRCPKAPPYIIALTAMVLDRDKQRCRECGMDYFIGKPIDMDELERVLTVVTKQLSV